MTSMIRPILALIRPTPSISTYILASLGACLWVSGCGQTPPPSDKPQLSNTLGPILGPVTKEKVLDRLKGYPICGMQVEEQKLTLKVRLYPLRDERSAEESQKNSEKKRERPNAHLVEVECFFFGVQGLYEFAYLTAADGRLTPLTFEGAEPVKRSLSRGAERRSPVALNKGRAEVCGVPQFRSDSQTLAVTCKADAGGGCGAHATYDLKRDPAGQKIPRFEVKVARFRSCGEAMNPQVEQWSEISP